MFPSVEETYTALINSRRAAAPGWTFTAEQGDTFETRGKWVLDKWTPAGVYAGQEIIAADYRNGNQIFETVKTINAPEDGCMNITADQLKAGDYIRVTYENGKRGGWIGVGSVSRHNNTVTAYGMTTSYEYPAGAIVTIEAR